MKKLSAPIFFILFFLSINSNRLIFPTEQSICTFNFPEEITYNIEERGHPLSDCTLSYKKHSEKPGMSYLELKTDHPSKSEYSATYFAGTTRTIYASYIYKGSKVSSQLLFQNAETIFGNEKDLVLIFKEPQKSNLQIELIADHQVIDTLLCYFLASKRVAECAFQENKQYSFYIDGKVKNVIMVHLGSEEIPYNDRPVPTELMALTFNNRLIFEMNIHTDQNGYTYPIKITIKDPHQNNKNALQLKATKITPPSPEERKLASDSEVFPVDG